jgi:hypothetical protein
MAFSNYARRHLLQSSNESHSQLYAEAAAFLKLMGLECPSYDMARIDLRIVPTLLRQII